MGSPQVAFGALLLGRFGPRDRDACPSLVSARDLPSFILGVGGSWSFGEIRVRDLHTTPWVTSPTSPCANFEDRAF